ncbi:Helix-turn-helix domain protein [Anoxybacillus sp. BCO1]|nr:Helix-turn-helix domain protein [Anoxybacillus sp. BCO1]
MNEHIGVRHNGPSIKITSVLADPTRYEIYQYIARKHQEVTVQEIADAFHIHPNVARLHLTKLEDVNMLVSENEKKQEKAADRADYTAYLMMSFSFIFRFATTSCYQKLRSMR